MAVEVLSFICCADQSLKSAVLISFQMNQDVNDDDLNKSKLAEAEKNHEVMAWRILVCNIYCTLNAVLIGKSVVLKLRLFSIGIPRFFRNLDN